MQNHIRQAELETVAVDRAHHQVWTHAVALDFFTHLAAFEEALEVNMELFVGRTVGAVHPPATR